LDCRLQELDIILPAKDRVGGHGNHAEIGKIKGKLDPDKFDTGATALSCCAILNRKKNRRVCCSGRVVDGVAVGKCHKMMERYLKFS
jgi:hypothetical protein